MTYQESVAYLESLIDYERTPAGAAAARVWNLDRMRHMLEHFGDPHLGLRCVHIAGTKGKGSTAALTAAMLRAGGLRTGLYTSPHLLSFRERIRIDGEMIPEEAVVRLVGEARPVMEEMGSGEIGAPSFFEAYTLLGLLHLAREAVDVSVIETGLGGRLDATNVVDPLACAITRIGRDHTVELGDTLEEIAHEKAGIIKPGVSVISSPQVPEVLDVLEDACLDRGAQLIVVGREGAPRVTPMRADEKQQVFSIHGIRGIYGELECPLLGVHQAENAAVAVGLVELLDRHGIRVEEPAVREGIASVRWPGRFQIVGTRPHIILDGAHDDIGAAALARTLESLYPGRRIILVLGVHKDKAAEDITAPLGRIADRVIVTASSSPRALDAHELQRVVFRHCRHTAAYTPVSVALREALNGARRPDVIVVTGSLYVVGDAMRALGLEHMV